MSRPTINKHMTNLEYETLRIEGLLMAQDIMRGER
jgi:hypothetical protein